MGRKRNADNLVRFVWSRNAEYDFALLVEVKEKNPFSFHKPTPIWKDIAETLLEGHLKMKVTVRSCRDRVTELLKKYRKEESLILRSTGATEDKVTEIKELLVIINEMALTEPSKKHSSTYEKTTRSEGERIRDAALDELTDSDSDDYINGTYSQGESSRTSCKRSRYTGEMTYVTSLNDFFNDTSTLEEEEAIFRGHDLASQRGDEEVIDAVGSTVGRTVKDIVTHVARETTETRSTTHTSPVPVGNMPAPSSASRKNSEFSSATQTSSALARKQTASNPQVNPSTTSTVSNSRFSNPKKDLINYLHKKSEHEFQYRKEEIRVREMEMENKKEELAILRLKTLADNEDRRSAREAEAQNKKEELQLQRLRTEAELEEKKKMLELLVSLIQKNVN